MTNYDWITFDFLQNILRKDKNDETIKLEYYTVSPALMKGENYSSDILKINIDYLSNEFKLRTHGYIIKSSLTDEGMAEMLDEYDIFKREIVVYRDILPKVQQLLLSAGDKSKLGPMCYHISEQKPKCFVFEDLTLSGFVNSDRKYGLSFSQAEMVLNRLAKWHAGTARLHTLDREIMKHHNYRNINEKTTFFWPLFTNSLLECAHHAREWATTKRTAEKLFKLEPNLMKKGCDVYTRDEHGFNVLNHGDLWVNNIMFKYQDEEPMDVTFVDYSIGYFGSPGIDLSYLLFISCDSSVKEREWDILIQDYHSELVSSLKKLHYPRKIPTLTDIHIEILRKGIIGVMYSTFLIPLRLLEDTAQADYNGLLANTDEARAFRKSLFGHPKYQERMEYLLDYYDRKGYLD